MTEPVGSDLLPPLPPPYYQVMCLVLTKTRPAQWVTLHHIYAYILGEMWFVDCTLVYLTIGISHMLEVTSYHVTYSSQVATLMKNLHHSTYYLLYYLQHITTRIGDILEVTSYHVTEATIPNMVTTV